MSSKHTEYDLFVQENMILPFEKVNPPWCANSFDLKEVLFLASKSKEFGYNYKIIKSVTSSYEIKLPKSYKQPNKYPDKTPKILKEP